MSDLLHNPKLCAVCAKPDSHFKCSCRQAHYCGPECQKRHWKEHKQGCAVALAGKVKEKKKELGRDSIEVSKARVAVGEAHMQHGQYLDAEKCFLEAHRIAKADEGNVYDAEAARNRLSGLYSSMGRYEEALEMDRESLRVIRAMEGDRSDSTATAMVQSNIGQTLIEQGKYQEALPYLEEALATFKKVHGQDYPEAALTMIHVGNIFFKKVGADMDKALESYGEALRILRKHETGSKYQDYIAKSLGNIASVYCIQGLFDKAIAAFEESLAITRKLRGETHPAVAMAMANMAQLLSKQGKLDEAGKMQRKALRIYRRALGNDHQDVARTVMNLGGTLSGQGKEDEALEMYEEALEIYSRTVGPDHPDLAGIHLSISSMKAGMEDLDGALTSAREAVRIYSKHGMPHDSAVELLKALEELKN